MTADLFGARWRAFGCQLHAHRGFGQSERSTELVLTSMTHKEPMNIAVEGHNCGMPVLRTLQYLRKARKHAWARSHCPYMWFKHFNFPYIFTWWFCIYCAKLLPGFPRHARNQSQREKVHTSPSAVLRAGNGTHAHHLRNRLLLTLHVNNHRTSKNNKSVNTTPPPPENRCLCEKHDNIIINTAVLVH